MTPESFTALGARLLLSRRFPHFQPAQLAAISDGAVITVASAALRAEDLIHDMAVAK